MKKTLSIVGVLMLMCGCTLAPTYQRPDAPVPAKWSGAANVSENLPKASEIAWQDFFTDETLKKLIEIALKILLS